MKSHINTNNVTQLNRRGRRALRSRQRQVAEMQREKNGLVDYLVSLQVNLAGHWIWLMAEVFAFNPQQAKLKAYKRELRFQGVDPSDIPDMEVEVNF